MDGKKCYPDDIDNKLQLSESVMKNIQKSEPVELFEKFVSISLKECIMEAHKDNEFDLQLDDLNTFIGIIILSSINKRKSQRDFWSTDPYLSLEVVRSATQWDKFEEIKLKFKYFKPIFDNLDYGKRLGPSVK